jgi:hypothetical protein
MAVAQVRQRRPRGFSTAYGIGSRAGSPCWSTPPAVRLRNATSSVFHQRHAREAPYGVGIFVCPAFLCRIAN